MGKGRDSLANGVARDCWKGAQPQGAKLWAWVQFHLLPLATGETEPGWQEAQKYTMVY